MDEQQRVLGFQKEYKELSDKWGIDFVAIAEGKQLGPVIQVEPKLNLTFKEGWVDPTIKQPEQTPTVKEDKPRLGLYKRNRR